MTTETSGNGNNSLVQGRIIWTLGSNLFEGKAKTDYNSGQPVIAQDGQPVKEYGFGLAIPKTDPTTGQPTEQFTKIWNALHQEAFTLYPSGQLPPDFAMKFKDGDGVDHNGKPFADREGYANHIILTCTTQIPIKWFVFEGGNNILVNTGIKCGDYIEAQLNIKAHPAKGRGKAGLYLNPGAARLLQAGKEIINAPSGDQIFGTTVPTYSGQVVADTTPAMPTTQAMPAAQPVQQPTMPAAQPVQQPTMPAAQPVQQPAMPAQAPVAPQAAPAHYGVLPETHQPAMPAVQPVQQPAMPAAQPDMAQVMGAPATASTVNAMPTVPAMPGMPV